MPMCDWEVEEKYAPIVAENDKLKYENEILRAILQNRNHVLGVAEPTYQPILDENEKLKEVNDGLQEKLMKDEEAHVADCEKLNGFYQKTKEENEKLKEEIKKLIEEIEFLVRIYVPS